MEERNRDADTAREPEKTEESGRFITAAVYSDKGLRRRNNEDNFCLNGRYMRREEMDDGGLFACSARGRAVFAVCDGMGGEEAGEEASLLSAQICAGILQDGQFRADEAGMRAFLLDGCISVMNQAQKNDNHSGSTVSILVADEDGIHAANMGDSRLYRLSGGQFTQVSEDHTEMQRLLRRGAITRAQMKTHPHRHMILQYWGMPLSMAPFSPFIAQPLPWVDGDRYLICSDGLTDMLEDEEISRYVRQEGKSLEAICRELMDAALGQGGRDNVTVMLLEVHDPAACQEEEEAPEKESFWRRLTGIFRKK